MDTQIRRVDTEPVAKAAPARRTLSLRPPAALIANAGAPAPSTSVERLREAVLRCATEAQSEEKTDTDARLHCFVAKLSGCMETLGESEMDHALWDLMKLRAEPARPVATAIATRQAARA